MSFPCFSWGQQPKIPYCFALAEPLRMALLIHEALRKFGESVKVEIGAPIWWETLSGQGGRSQLTYYLYRQVQKLSKS